MKFAALFLALSMAAAWPQNITVQVGGRPVGSASTLNFESGTGIIQSCHPDGNARITCTPSYDLAVVASRDSMHGNENTCISATHSTSYACRISRATLLAYPPGMTFVLTVDVPCANQCSLNIDALGPVRIKRSDGVTDPLGTLVPGEPQWVFYDGQIFRLMGGGGGGSRPAGQDRDRDATARRFIAAMETMPYARTVSLETTAGDVHKTTTSNAVGNATINAATVGFARPAHVGDRGERSDQRENRKLWNKLQERGAVDGIARQIRNAAIHFRRHRLVRSGADRESIANRSPPFADIRTSNMRPSTAVTCVCEIVSGS